MFEASKVNYATTKMAGHVFSMYGEKIADHVRRIVDDKIPDLIPLMKANRWSATELVIFILGEALSQMDESEEYYAAVSYGFIYVLNQVYEKEQIPEMYKQWTAKEQSI